jgi:hypothetical protein
MHATIRFSLLSSRLLSRNVKVKKILPVVLYGCETWSLTLREEHRPGVGILFLLEGRINLAVIK